MRHEAESKCYVAFVNADGTSHPIAEYLEYWQDIPAQSVADAAPDFDRLIYLVRIRLSFEDRTRNTRNNESLESLLLTRFEPTKTTGVKDKWLAEWLRNLSFEDFFLVCRIGSRLVKQPLFREFSDRIIKYIHQKRRRVTSSNYDQAFRLLKTQIHAQDELKRQWDAHQKTLNNHSVDDVLEVDLDAKTHRDDTTPNSTNADLPSTETTINNSAGSAAPQRDNTPLSSAQPNNLPPIYDASLSPSEQQTQAQLIDAAVDSRAPKRLKTQREDLNTTREVHHPLSRPTPDTRNNTNPAQPLAGTSDQNLNAPQSRDDGPEESLDEAQPPPSTNPIIHENIPPNTTADGLLKAHNCEPVIRNDDSLTRLPPSTRVGGYTRKRVADENTGPDGRGKLQPTQIQTGGGGSVDEQAENNSELVDGTPGRGAVGYALQEVLQHGRGPQQGTLEQQEGHTSDPYQHRQPQEIQNQGTQPGGATWQEARDGPPPRDISYLQNSRRSYSPHPNPRQVGQRLRVANSANLSQQTHPSPPRVGAFQNAVPQFQPPYDHSPNVPPRQGDRPVQDVHYTNVHPQPNPLQSNAQHTYSIPQSNPQYVYPTQHSGQPPLPNWTQKYPPQRGQFFQAGNSTNSLPQSGQDPNWQDGRTYQAVNPQAPQVSYPQVSLAHGNIPHMQQPLLQRGGGVLQPAPLEHRHHNIDFLLSSSTVSVAGHAAPNATGTTSPPNRDPNVSQRFLMVEKFCQVLKTQNVLLTTEELGQGPEVVFWQQVGSWSLPDNLKGKYAIGSIIKIGKLCDDFQQLGKDAQLTVEFRKDFKVIPSTVIMGKKFEWSSIFFFKAAYQAFERLNGNSL